MDIAGILFKQNVIMLVYLVIGFWLYKRKMVTKTGSAEIGKLLLNVIMPVAIVKSYIRDYSGELLAQLGVSFLLSLLSLVLAILISSLFFNKDKAVRRFGAAFSNAGFIGIPLIQATLGDHAVFYVASFVALLPLRPLRGADRPLSGDDPRARARLYRLHHAQALLGGARI